MLKNHENIFEALFLSGVICHYIFTLRLGIKSPKQTKHAMINVMPLSRYNKSMVK
jgi:hypothetical protein